MSIGFTFTGRVKKPELLIAAAKRAADERYYGLSQWEDGLSVRDCVNVRFDPDVPADLIRERLVSVTDCVHVICTEDQRPAIEAVAADVVHMGPGGEDTGEGEPDGDTSKVFAALYVL